MLGSILFFLLFLFLLAVLLVAFVLRKLFYNTGLDRLFSIFRNLQGGPSGDGQGTNQRSRSAGRQTTTHSGDVIIDRRDPEKANQKIFKNGEGEYVDYKEE